jgi:hypothetical protein
MKKLLLLTALAFALTAGSGFAQNAGQFGFGIELTGLGTLAFNNGVATLYALDNSGGTRLLPTGSSATLSTAWTGASTAAAPTFNLGTFLQSDTLDLDGGSYLTFKNGGADVTGTTLSYRITPGATGSGSYAPAISLPFNEDNVNGATGDQRWSLESGTTNLIAGLAPGTYTLSVYGAATVTGAYTTFSPSGNGTLYENNGGGGTLDYSATFTVVPEPSAWAMMLGGVGFLVAFQRLRSRRVS